MAGPIGYVPTKLRPIAGMEVKFGNEYGYHLFQGPSAASVFSKTWTALPR